MRQAGTQLNSSRRFWLNEYFVNPESIHVHHLEPVARPFDLVPFAGHAPQLGHDEATQGVELLSLFAVKAFYTQSLLQVGQREGAIYQQRAIVSFQH